jgi:pimeloyl-ACP methyl ester carboxylesterase
MRSVIGALLAVLLLGCNRGPQSQPAVSPPDAKSPPTTEEVSFGTTDGLTIHGYFLDAGGTKGVILLHMWGHDARTWTPYLAAFKDKGVSALAIDARGYGKSEVQDGKQYKPEWDLSKDIAAAAAFLRDEKGVKEIGIAGASYGANNALIYAAEHPETKAVALLSAGADYHGLKIAGAAAKYKGKALVWSSKGDRGASSAPGIISGALGDRATVRLFDGSLHGTALLDDDPKLAGELAAYFAQNLGTD